MAVCVEAQGQSEAPPAEPPAKKYKCMMDDAEADVQEDWQEDQDHLESGPEQEACEPQPKRIRQREKLRQLKPTRATTTPEARSAKSIMSR